MMNQHSIIYQFYADDTQLQNRDFPENVSSLLKTTSDCNVDIRNWMTQSKLQRNGDKTEVMLVGTKQTISAVSTDSIQLGENYISPVVSMNNLGIILAGQHFLHEQVDQSDHSVQLMSAPSDQLQPKIYIT